MKGLKAIVDNDNASVIIGSNTTIVVPNSDEDVTVVLNDGSTHRISQQLYSAIRELVVEVVKFNNEEI